MNQELVDKIVAAVLYEGYILYPYRPSVKNQHRWTFGGIYPQAYSRQEQGSEPCAMQTQCLIDGQASRVRIRVRFLHLTARQVLAGDQSAPRPVEALTVNGRLYQTWQEAVERDLDLGDFSVTDLAAIPASRPITFPVANQIEILRETDGRQAGQLRRRQEKLDGVVELSSQQKSPGLFTLTMRIINRSELAAVSSQKLARDDALLHSFVSTHTILSVTGGKFISLTDPPPELGEIARACQNIGCWPVLVGRPGETDTLLSSPIILSDYPQVACESPGDLFDATEIDEILTLRILTLTDEEKRQAAAIDPRGRDMLARTESLAREQLMNLHGAVRGLKPVSFQQPPPVPEITPIWDPLAEHKALGKILSAGIELRPGDRVRLMPRPGGDIFDIALAGKTATIASIEQDFENRIHLAVTVDDDPGSDLGASGKPGHRFFFSPEEVEVLPNATADRSRS